MTPAGVIRDAIVVLSAFSVGSALFTAALCLRMLPESPRRWAAFAAAKVGYALVVGTVLVRVVLTSREVPSDLYAWAYLIGLSAAGLGFLGVGRAVRRDFVAWEDARRETGATIIDNGEEEEDHGKR